MGVGVGVGVLLGVVVVVVGGELFGSHKGSV